MGVDNTLAYIDQGSFLALRALGRQPIMQFIWIYEYACDINGLRRFQGNLRYGTLGRNIETSPIPFGRHRWVSRPGPIDFDIAGAARPRDQVWDWADERIRIPTDPEHGPAWHLGVQPLTTGGAAVSLVVSHSVADAIGMCQAITDAVRGDRRDFGYPEPHKRTYKEAVKQDLRVIARSLPDIARAVSATVKTLRTSTNQFHQPPPKKTPSVRSRDNRPVIAPTATAWIDLDNWDQRAQALGGTSNSLFAAIATRLAALLGREGPDHRVLLSWPVSGRVAGDTRANALTAALMTAESTAVTTTLATIRADMKSALTTASRIAADMVDSMAIVQFTPKILVKLLDRQIANLGTVGCSNLGVLDPLVNCPDGTGADRIAFRSLEPNITKAILDRSHGYLYLGAGRINGRIFISANGWVPGEANTKELLRERLEQAVSDMALTAEIE